uniref:Retrovirus-related Pol polyprotein from transposon TNT 1-94 n=1 Tax=Ananas comosus var. bracteatus TaxID=296719 RepID=A0A6V7NEY0_ANACO|nr:unnamed protein product [Ananas comosus var. bracteatus]
MGKPIKALRSDRGGEYLSTDFLTYLKNRPKKLLGLSQAMYIDEVLKRFSMENSKRGMVPLRHGIHLSKTMSPKTPEERSHMSRIPYASAIGSLMYAMLCTRPDIAQAVSVTSRYQSNPGQEHWVAVKNILKYLRRTKDMSLVFEEENLELMAMRIRTLCLI